MNTIEKFLVDNGPSRSSSIVKWLVQDCGATQEAARKRVSRIKEPLRKFPIPLFPKGESFIYEQHQRREERFWTNLHRDLRASGSVFGICLDGLIGRRGVVLEQDFAGICGGTVNPQRGQLTSKSICNRLANAGVVERHVGLDGKTYVLVNRDLHHADMTGQEARRLGEGIVLDGLRQWARNLGLASYNKISIHGDSNLKAVGNFHFDLGGPSYLLALRSGGKQPGFLVADVLSDVTLDEYQIRFFTRKASVLSASLKGGRVLALLVADGFTGQALKEGHAAGIFLATPANLFGQRVGSAISALIQTLKNAAAFAASSPEKLVKLIDDLAGIEGAAGNLRGVLFELLVAYLARRNAVSIDVGVRALDPESGKLAEIDVLQITGQAAKCTSIECKGKNPGGIVTLDEVDDWLRRIPIFVAHLRKQSTFRESKLEFEIWTSGTFDQQAIARLSEQNAARTRNRIGWKDGQQVLEVAKAGKDKAIVNALREHFIRHPLEGV